MNAQIRTLKADMTADVRAIAELYAALERYDPLPHGEEPLIAVAYYLHNLSCAFERLFQRVAEVFEPQLSERAGWHAALLRRMTLDIEGIRPRCSVMPRTTAWTNSGVSGPSFAAPLDCTWMRSAWHWSTRRRTD